MIALLTGKPTSTRNGLIIDVHGVGYLVSVSSTLANKAIQSESCTLHIHTHVREDSLELYGFSSAEEKELFLLLLSVSGVGPRIALAIVEKGGTALITAVQQADVAFFSATPRVGKKLAQKIIIELKSKLGSLQDLDLGPVSEQQSTVLEALLSLGFNPQQSEQVVRDIDPTLPIEKAVQQAIQKLGST